MYHMVHIERIALALALLCGLTAFNAAPAQATRGSKLVSGGAVRWTGGPLSGTALDRVVAAGQGDLCVTVGSCERFDLDVRLRPVRGAKPQVVISVLTDVTSQPFIHVVFPDGRQTGAMGIAFECAGGTTLCSGWSRVTVNDPPSGRWRVYVSCEFCAATMYSAEARAPLPDPVPDCARARAHGPGHRPHAASPIRAAACTTHIGYASKSPMIAVDQRNRVFVYPALDPGAFIARSDDRGRRWQRISPYPGGFPATVLPTDPFFYRDPKTGRLFEADLLGAKCQSIAFSDDAGRSWTTSVAGCSQFDFQTVFAGRPRTSRTTGYPNVVYTCAVNTVATIVVGFSTTCEKSLDGGVMWLPTGGPAWLDTSGPECNGGHGAGVAGPDGSIYIPRGGCGHPEVAISRDEGATWKRVRVSKTGVLLNSFGWYEPKTSLDVDRLGNLYYAWTGRDRLPRVSVSRDRGETWSRPVVVTAPGVKEVSLTTIAVGAPGKVVVAYMGTTNSNGPPFNEHDSCVTEFSACFEDQQRNDSAQPLDMGEAGYDGVTWNGYITVSTNMLTKRPTFFSAPVNPESDPLVRGSCSIRCRSNGDRIDVDIAPDGTPWAAFVDTCTRSCVHGGPSEGQDGLAAFIRGVGLR